MWWSAKHMWSTHPNFDGHDGSLTDMLWCQGHVGTFEQRQPQPFKDQRTAPVVFGMLRKMVPRTPRPIVVRSGPQRQRQRPDPVGCAWVYGCSIQRFYGCSLQQIAPKKNRKKHFFFLAGWSFFSGVFLRLLRAVEGGVNVVF